MDEAVEPRLEFDEGSEITDARDRSLDAGADYVLLRGERPGIGLKLLEAERNPLLARIDFQNFDVELLADRKNIRRLVHPPVRDVGNMQHAVDAADVNESAVIEQAANGPANDRPGLQV